MNVNKFIKVGTILLLTFAIVEVMCYSFFEIRDKVFYEIIHFIELLFALLVSITLLIGFFKLHQAWKWLVIFPIIAGWAFVLLGFIMFSSPMPNEITVKEDTETLFVNKTNGNRKIIRQVYKTGVTGDKLNVDTLKVHELTSLFRFAVRTGGSQIQNDWLKVEKIE